MGVREKLNDNRIGMKVAVAVLILGVGTLSLRLFGGRSTNAVSLPTTAFYTDDNGKTFFKDDINKIPPFDHGGKQAYRADVFRAGNGKQFVGLVYRFTETGRREIEGYLAKKPSDPDGMVRLSIEQRGMQVKPASAGDKAWVIADDAMVQRLQGSIKDSSGNPAVLVTP